ncbi:hypothetical protein OG875_30825 [Streptomyces sp. NBC_01498]|uniref:hypothetical protein n=1 Tax=Streptomyces sp. NBC_01498 TaxID=2975870 RepID=UPI002E7B4DEF|nr:hypothetical protein [Streptomyces sp. NBC_01498]WTL28594.1 hypothetical protein OG875_30825 [Streptomyces sp. NBC_01498]
MRIPATIDAARLRAVCAAIDGRRAYKGLQLPDATGEDILAALTQLAEARAELEALERDLTRAARTRRISWERVARTLGLASRTSAESRFVRLERGCRESPRRPEPGSAAGRAGRAGGCPARRGVAGPSYGCPPGR